MQELLLRGLKKFRILKKINFSFTKKINHHRFRIPIISGSGEQNIPVHEQWMDSVLQKLLALKRGAFIDVGVNVGQTLLKIKSIDPDIEYYGFEPNPTCVFYVNRLIEANKIENVYIFPVAIAEKAGITELNFYFDSDTDAAASMIKDFRPVSGIRKSVFIPCLSINDVKSFIWDSSVSIIKVDVEGAELDVLKGLSSFLETLRPFVLMEILPVYEAENKFRLDRQLEIERILLKNNYKIIRIKKNNDRFFSLEMIDAIGIHSNQDWCDYIFCPGETHLQLIS
ncbi:MAG TPA: FkbM family methyltransferase [Chitinophagaceae bacterium]